MDSYRSKKDKQKILHTRPGFLDDLVKNRYCDADDLGDVLRELRAKQLDVVRVGEEYFFALAGNCYYLVETDSCCFVAGQREVPIFKVKKFDRKNNQLVLENVDSDTGSPLVRELYLVVEGYFKQLGLWSPPIE